MQLLFMADDWLQSQSAHSEILELWVACDSKHWTWSSRWGRKTAIPPRPGFAVHIDNRC